eukprot:8850852-Alexandrium_andersonii.AAC.1
MTTRETAPALKCKRPCANTLLSLVACLELKASRKRSSPDMHVAHGPDSTASDQSGIRAELGR